MDFSSQSTQDVSAPFDLKTLNMTFIENVLHDILSP